MIACISYVSEPTTIVFNGEYVVDSDAERVTVSYPDGRVESGVASPLARQGATCRADWTDGDLPGLDDVVYEAVVAGAESVELDDDGAEAQSGGAR